MQDASFHLAADDGAEDFRADGALSTSAPKVKPRLLADVLWEAANVHLAPECTETQYTQGIHKWSCWAIDRALGLKPQAWDALSGEPWDYLKQLGLVASPYHRLSLPDQGVRYMWLLLAMHVAEDEGITV